MLDGVGRQVEAMRSATGTALDDAGSVAGALDEHHRALAASARDLRATHEAVESEIERRRIALDALASSIGERAGELDAAMGHFTALIGETLGAAENRARDLGAYLAETAQAAAGLVGDHFEEVRFATGREGEKAAAALEQAYAGAVRDMERLFADALERFRGSAGEVGGMASEIARQFEEARADLQRATIELPRETAEQAQEVRRVIGQQVEALEALTALIVHVGDGEDAPDAPRGRSATPAALPAPAPALPAPKATVPASIPAASARGGKRGGWLSDLLAKVDRDDAADEATRAETSMAEAVPAATPVLAGQAGGTAGALAALDGVATDIARLVYDSALIDAWDRHARGERGAFTERLYTPAGQASFAEIRHRYDADTAFRETVERYVGEFERLLRDAGQADIDGARARGIIAAATGKVYVLLAHAAGRLG